MRNFLEPRNDNNFDKGCLNSRMFFTLIPFQKVPNHYSEYLLFRRKRSGQCIWIIFWGWKKLSVIKQPLWITIVGRKHRNDLGKYFFLINIYSILVPVPRAFCVCSLPQSYWWYLLSRILIDEKRIVLGFFGPIFSWVASPYFTIDICNSAPIYLYRI